MYSGYIDELLILRLGYVHSKVLRKLNPLELTIRIPASKPTTSASSERDPKPNQAIYDRVRTYLAGLLEAEFKSHAHPVLSGMSSKQVKEQFTRQFDHYSRLQYPFDKPLAAGQSVLSWWQSLVPNTDSAVLAVCYNFI